jgi:hypothetical protein
MNDEHGRVVKQLAGVWRLVSSEFRTSSGDVIYPLGEDALGQAIFTESGYMSGQLMRQNRPWFASGSQASGTREEIEAALQGYVAYYGSCQVDVEQKTITTDVEGSLYPNWVGGQQVRYYELTDSRLVLTTSPIAFGDEEITGVLTWERK